MISRHKYIVSKSFRSYLAATILTLVINQVCLTTDGILMAHLVDPDALSAINLMSPFNMIMATVHALFAIGASVLAGKALGAQKKMEARRIFSVSILSGLLFIVLVVLLCFAFFPYVVKGLCPEERIQRYLGQYMQMYLFLAPVSMLSVLLKLFVGVDGNPSLVTRAATLEGLLNIAFDVFLVAVVGMGIAGSALGTGIGQFCTICIMLWYIRSPRSAIGFEWRIPKWWVLLWNNMKEGMPTMLGNLVTALAALGINYIVMDAQGADGVFILSICMQTMSLSMLALNGCGSTLFSVGSVLMGEKDIDGVKILTRYAFSLTCIFTALLSAFVLIWPDGLAMLYGAKTDHWLDVCRLPLREFALMLFPLAIIMLSKFLYQLLGHRKLSSIIATLVFILILPSLLVMGWIAPKHIWLGFPIVAFICLAGQFGAISVIARKLKNCHFFTLIPIESDVTNRISLSLPYNQEKTGENLREVVEMMKANGWPLTVINHVMLVAEELTKNICQHAVAHPRVQQHFDMVINRLDDGGVQLVLKDDGVLFDPRAKEVKQYTEKELMTLPTDSLEFGLMLARNSSTEMTCRQMYGLNVTYVTIKI